MLSQLLILSILGQSVESARNDAAKIALTSQNSLPTRKGQQGTRVMCNIGALDAGYRDHHSCSGVLKRKKKGFLVIGPHQEAKFKQKEDMRLAHMCSTNDRVRQRCPRSCCYYGVQPVPTTTTTTTLGAIRVCTLEQCKAVCQQTVSAVQALSLESQSRANLSVAQYVDARNQGFQYLCDHGADNDKPAAVGCLNYHYEHSHSVPRRSRGASHSCSYLVNALCGMPGERAGRRLMQHVMRDPDKKFTMAPPLRKVELWCTPSLVEYYKSLGFQTDRFDSKTGWQLMLWMPARDRNTRPPSETRVATCQ